MSNSNAKYVRDVISLVAGLAAMGIRINDIPNVTTLDNLTVAKFSDICDQVEGMVIADSSLVRNSITKLILEVVEAANVPKTKYTEAEMLAYIAIMASTNLKYNSEQLGLTSEDRDALENKMLMMARDESPEFEKELFEFAGKLIKSAK